MEKIQTVSMVPHATTTVLPLLDEVVFVNYLTCQNDIASRLLSLHLGLTLLLVTLY
jgi:hypothetical protein